MPAYGRIVEHLFWSFRDHEYQNSCCMLVIHHDGTLGVLPVLLPKVAKRPHELDNLNKSNLATAQHAASFT
jgi:hypothetical protein